MGKDRVNPGWKIGEAELLHRAYIFDFCKRSVVTPRDHHADYYLLRSRDWVNVIPLTATDEVILIKQFRPNINAYCLEIPGGLIDENEDPKAAAIRELQEETGFQSPRLTSLGSARPNPAILSNTCHYFVAHDVEPTGRIGLEPCEDITVVKVPLSTIPELILNHELSHAIMLPAFLRFFLDRGIIRP